MQKQDELSAQPRLLVKVAAQAAAEKAEMDANLAKEQRDLILSAAKQE